MGGQSIRGDEGFLRPRNFPMLAFVRQSRTNRKKLTPSFGTKEGQFEGPSKHKKRRTNGPKPLDSSESANMVLTEGLEPPTPSM